MMVRRAVLLTLSADNAARVRFSYSPRVVVEGEADSRLAVNQVVAGASPVDHPLTRRWCSPVQHVALSRRRPAVQIRYVALLPL